MINPASNLKNKKADNTFGAFALGIAVGVGAALLFGTDEGKKIAVRLFDSLPEKIKNLTDDTSPVSILSEPESTPHTYIYNEPPPPPAPHVTPTLPRIS